MKSGDWTELRGQLRKVLIAGIPEIRKAVPRLSMLRLTPEVSLREKAPHYVTRGKFFLMAYSHLGEGVLHSLQTPTGRYRSLGPSFFSDFHYMNIPGLQRSQAPQTWFHLQHLLAPRFYDEVPTNEMLGHRWGMQLEIEVPEVTAHEQAEAMAWVEENIVYRKKGRLEERLRPHRDQYGWKRV